MNKPLKRNANLVWLSRDHHDGLLIVWKLRQGLALKKQLSLLADFIGHQFAFHLAPHFADEEKWLFTTLSDSDALRMKAEAQHANIRQLVSGIETAATEELLQQFINELEEHIRFEERELFPHIEQQLGEETLAVIGKELMQSHEKREADTWTSTFWIKEKNI